MMQRSFLGALFLAAVAGAAAAADRPAVNSPAPAATANATNEQVIAYYFHGTMRCETCLKIEKQARETIERQFQKEIYEKRLVFKPVNYDKPENAHFLKDYKLPCPSLVVVRQKGGKDEKWKLLGETWDLIANPFKLNEYVEREVGKIVRDLK
ncbi:MAG: nitrophenyl compound nitroreductase subunit ArsF family protein [Verrucomicrobia bacterium]|nr:nitrophenyl compound nitroreductase subunit ArsF family protein [Verrucomicrobiota bacterium]